ncbi:uncharacterized protein LOC142350472 [Convolutriloba macropyga]|uniref:uncharacterized protein LOC142350472 n=1 Tax=Convolutriloba macropyga TaxID=536237 RepID=UPI003F528614
MMPQVIFLVFLVVRGHNWKSLEFVIPDRSTDLGRKCQIFSSNFCLTTFRDRGFEKTDRNSSILADALQFRVLIEPQFRRINWFSFSPDDKQSILPSRSLLERY